MLYVIHAFEEKYGGYYGMEDWSIWNCDNEKEAISIARENSIDVINSYSCIYDELESDIESFIDETMSEEEKEQLCEDIFNEDIAYSIWKIDSDIVKEYNIDVLEKWLNDDPEDFIEKYCENAFL